MLEDVRISSDDTKFRRKENGLEFGIPLFHSGRNYFNFRSAGAQKKVAAENVRKVRGEIIFEITRAYYNLIRSQRSVKSRKEINQRSEKVIDMARKKKEAVEETVVEEVVEGTVVQHLDRDPNDPRVNRSERGDSLPAYDEVVEEDAE
jgi:hypothetical protein